MYVISNNSSLFHSQSVLESCRINISKMKFLAIYLIFVLHLYLCKGLVLECHYHFRTFSYGEKYTCDIDNDKHIKFEDITDVTGMHLENKTNDDVQVVNADDVFHELTMQLLQNASSFISFLKIYKSLNSITATMR